MKIKDLFEERMSPDDIVKWMNDHTLDSDRLYERRKIELWSHHNDVSYKGRVDLDLKCEELPFKFFKIDGWCQFNNPKSLINAPDQASGFGLESIKDISFEHIPKVTHYEFNVPSLSGLHNHVKSAENIQVGPNIKRSLITLLKIKCYNIRLSLVKSEYTDEFKQAFDILSKYVPNENRNIVKCQRELIDNDLDEYAEL